ncbi:MAG: hypothetical protein SFV54_09805 [Bryobacteraceae bacterium]|nr:hypothetical protein [Bryobacteraceae bacterium]
MAPDTPAEPPSPLVLRVLAGLEVGVFGGLLMLAWFVLDAWLRHEFLWKVPNLIASSVYGPLIFRRAFGLPTLAGIAIHTISAGLIGMLFGLAMIRLPGPARRTVYAFGASFGWYWLGRTWLWNVISPLLPYYATTASLVMGHLLYAVSLATFASRFHRLSRALAPPPPVPAADAVPASAIPVAPADPSEP